MNPIEQLKQEMSRPRDRVMANLRSEWPKLWEAIDAIVALNPSEVEVEDGKSVVAFSFDYLNGFQGEAQPFLPEPRKMIVKDAQGAKYGRVVGDETEELFAIEDITVPVADIVSFAGTDPQLWAAWFNVFLADNPDSSVEVIEEWFEAALNARAIEEVEHEERPIEVIFDEVGGVVSMATSIVESFVDGWNEDEPGLDPERPSLIDPEAPGLV